MRISDWSSDVCSSDLIAFEPRRRVFRPLPFVPMRQQQHEAVGTQPLGLAGGDELIDHDLRAVGEIAELGFPKHQRFGIGERIAVFEIEPAIFGERRIEHLETAMLDVIERYIFVLVDRKSTRLNSSHSCSSLMPSSSCINKI